jgi:hypothetical protein
MNCALYLRSTAMRWNFREYRFLPAARVSSPGECAHHECANSKGHSSPPVKMDRVTGRRGGRISESLPDVGRSFD